MKKNADQFIDDLINGGLQQFSGSPDETYAKLVAVIDAEYSFDEQEIQEALLRSRDKIEAVIGVSLTDEQLVAITGGKSDAQKVGLGAGLGGAVAVGGAAAAGAAVGTYVLIAILVK